MDIFLERLKPLVDNTVSKLQKKEFDPDPIAGSYLSKVVSVMGSAYKRHTYILKRSLIELLKDRSDLIVLEDTKFYINNQTDRLIEHYFNKPETILTKEVDYIEDGRLITIDLITYNKNTNLINSYIIKRGNGMYDGGTKKLLMKDILSLKVLLKSFSKFKNFNANKTMSNIIFYYGKRSIPKPFSLIRDDLDEHFNFAVREKIEKVNEYFKLSLIKMTNEYRD